MPLACHPCSHARLLQSHSSRTTKKDQRPALGRWSFLLHRWQPSNQRTGLLLARSAWGGVYILPMSSRITRISTTKPIPPLGP